jgi:magnesium chelatase subunit I
VGESSEEKVLARLVQRAVLNVFNRTVGAAALEPVVAAFQNGLAVEVSDTMAAAGYANVLEAIPQLRSVVEDLGARDPAACASAVEFVLEGLHLARKLNKEARSGQVRYRG